jgi:hypothetical protein
MPAESRTENGSTSIRQGFPESSRSSEQGFCDSLHGVILTGPGWPPRQGNWGENRDFAQVEALRRVAGD